MAFNCKMLSEIIWQSHSCFSFVLHRIALYNVPNSYVYNFDFYGPRIIQIYANLASYGSWYLHSSKHTLLL